MPLSINDAAQERLSPVREVRPFENIISFSESVAPGAPGLAILDGVLSSPTTPTIPAVFANRLSGTIVCEAGRSATLVVSVSLFDTVYFDLHPLWLHSGVNVIRDLMFPALAVRLTVYLDALVLGNSTVRGFLTLRSVL